MRALIEVRRALLFAGAVSFIVFCSGCSDKGVEPKPQPEDFKVYFATATGPPKLFSYHSISRQIDSVDLPWPAGGGVTVSANGNRLYLNDGLRIRVVDARTLSPITELVYSYRSVAVSPDDRLVALTGKGITILRTSDYSAVFSDTDVALEGHFSADSRAFYCPVGWHPDNPGPPVAYRVTFGRKCPQVTRRTFLDGGVGSIVPSLDQTKWFLYIQFGLWRSVFEVYDVASDSIIFRKLLIPGYGEIALTPDGRKVIISNPGRSGTDPPPPLGFTIFDVRENRVAHEIIDTAFFSSDMWRSVPACLAVTPDSRWLFMMSAIMTNQVVYLYDLSANRPVDRWDGDSRAFMNLSVQLSR
jgi:hypothetical protein